MNGKGTLFWANGDIYEGAMTLRKRHGQGVLFTTEGTKILGKWFEDELVDDNAVLAYDSKNNKD